jgi:hypothetical protein
VEETRALPRAGKVRTARDVESRAQQGEQLLGVLEGEGQVDPCSRRRSEGIGQRPVAVNGHPRAAIRSK